MFSILRFLPSGVMRAICLSQNVSGTRCVSTLIFRGVSAANNIGRGRVRPGISVRQQFSSSSTYSFSEPAPTELADLSFLSDKRCAQLQEQSLVNQAANEALAAAKENHPSHLLIQLLIADSRAWQTLHREWKQLVNNEARWESLLSMRATYGETKLDERLRMVYGLTSAAAEAILTVLKDFRRKDCIPEPMNKNKDGLSTPGATVSRFVDWCGAQVSLQTYATTSKLHQPLMIVGGMKSGKTTLLRHVLPGVIKAAHPADRFLVLHVDWSRLIDARDFTTLFYGFQVGVTEALLGVELNAPPIFSLPRRGTKTTSLSDWLAEVENVCLVAGFRPLHLWDETAYLFKFGAHMSSPMFAALRPTLLNKRRKSVYAMTTTASQVFLRELAGFPRPHPDTDTNPWNYTHCMMIPTPHPDYDREQIELAAQNALDLYYKEHPELLAKCTVEAIKQYWTTGDVISPAIAMEVARTMSRFGDNVSKTVLALQHQMDHDWIFEALPILNRMDVTLRRKLWDLAVAKTPQPIDSDVLYPAINAVKSMMFRMEKANPHDALTPDAVVVPSYARRIQMVLLPSGEIDETVKRRYGNRYELK